MFLMVTLAAHCIQMSLSAFKGKNPISPRTSVSPLCHLIPLLFNPHSVLEIMSTFSSLSPKFWTCHHVDLFLGEGLQMHMTNDSGPCFHVVEFGKES